MPSLPPSPGETGLRRAFWPPRPLSKVFDEPLVLLIVAEEAEEHGRAEEVLRLLRRAADIAPEEPDVWHRLGGVLVRQGQWADGLAAFRTALRLHPDFVAALIGAGSASFRLGGLTAAEEYFRRAAALVPSAAEPVAALAALAARRNRPEDARSLAERALALNPGMITAELAIGRADLLDGLPDATRARMDALLVRSDLSDDDRVAALDRRAEAFDALDRTAEAFADYDARNAVLREVSAPRIAQAGDERRVEQASRLIGYFSRAAAEPWRSAAGQDAIGRAAAGGHAFLLGFPRSGTTLLERVLSAHPRIVALEEVDHLGRVGQQWLTDDLALDHLANLPRPEADAARQAYWRGVRETLGGDLSGKLVVDKLPLHTVALPVISKLFPDARILFALRDPRDVVLSCFRRRFLINSAMFEFLRLGDATRYYDRVMTLAHLYREVLPLRLLEVRHERMVVQFEAAVRDVLEFVGLDWDPAVSHFSENRRADPRTPSDVQLSRGLNADGVGQWRRYRTQLAPILPILESWVTRLGYPP